MMMFELSNNDRARIRMSKPCSRFFFPRGPKTRIGSEPGRRAKTAVKFKIQKHIAVNSQLCKENYIYYPKTGSVANKKI